jgi:hypothetical protein
MSKKLPQAGEYWGVRGRDRAALKVIGHFDGDCVVRKRDGTISTFNAENWKSEDWQHLPECTGFDWVPETWPKWIINPKGFSDDTVYLRRDSKDVTVRVLKDGTEHANYWDANRDGFVRSGAWI